MDLGTLKTGFFVNGARINKEKGKHYTSHNPADGKEIASFPLANKEDTEQAAEAAREAFDSGPWPRLSLEKRLAILRRFSEVIREHSETLGTLESLDVGKLKKDCIEHDVARASANISFFADAVEQQHDEEFLSEAKFLGRDLRLKSVVKRSPVGVAALVIPWNSPLMLATWKIGPCLATGNCCVVKPAPWASLSILQLGELANEAGIPRGVLNIITGDGEAGDALVRSPKVDRVSFTGSVPTGKIVARANAETRLAPISLELGGKSPSIVFADADLDLSVAGVARGIFRSQGQSCVAGSRLLLHESIYDSFLARLIEHAESLVVGDPTDENSQLGPLITSEHLNQVEEFVTSAVSDGAKLETGGERISQKNLKDGNYFAPTILSNISEEMRIWKEEVFGPVLVVRPFRTQEEAISLANNSEYGLSASIWTENLDKAMSTAEALQSGMVWLNSHFLRDLRAPFGGTKNSGIGREGGRYSLEFYTEPKMICSPY